MNRICAIWENDIIMHKLYIYPVFNIPSEWHHGIFTTNDTRVLSTFRLRLHSISLFFFNLIILITIKSLFTPQSQNFRDVQ